MGIHTSLNSFAKELNEIINSKDIIPANKVKDTWNNDFKKLLKKYNLSNLDKKDKDNIKKLLEETIEEMI